MHTPDARQHAWRWPLISAALCMIAAASWAVSHRAAPAEVTADDTRASWVKRVTVQVQTAPGEESRCNEPTEPDQRTKQQPPSVPAPAKVKPDPLTGDAVRRAPVAKGCACAALDPACACLPLASPCPVPGAAADGPCRYF